MAGVAPPICSPQLLAEALCTKSTTAGRQRTGFSVVLEASEQLGTSRRYTSVWQQLDEFPIQVQRRWARYQATNRRFPGCFQSKIQMRCLFVRALRVLRAEGLNF